MFAGAVMLPPLARTGQGDGRRAVGHQGEVDGSGGGLDAQDIRRSSRQSVRASVNIADRRSVRRSGSRADQRPILEEVHFGDAITIRRGGGDGEAGRSQEDGARRRADEGHRRRGVHGQGNRRRSGLNPLAVGGLGGEGTGARGIHGCR